MSSVTSALSRKRVAGLLAQQSNFHTRGDSRVAVFLDRDSTHDQVRDVVLRQGIGSGPGGLQHTGRSGVLPQRMCRLIHT